VTLQEWRHCSSAVQAHDCASCKITAEPVLTAQLNILPAGTQMPLTKNKVRGISTVVNCTSQPHDSNATGVNAEEYIYGYLLFMHKRLPEYISHRVTLGEQNLTKMTLPSLSIWSGTLIALLFKERCGSLYFSVLYTVVPKHTVL
jgi:hypothetical protein